VRGGRAVHRKQDRLILAPPLKDAHIFGKGDRDEARLGKDGVVFSYLAEGADEVDQLVVFEAPRIADTVEGIPVAR
jgi:hypothetical protein